MVSIDANRGQVGIGILVIFMAMILIAAMAASTLIHESNRLQTKAQDASEDTARQAAGHMLVSSASGEVTENGSLGTIEIVVRPGPGASQINVEKSAISWASDETATILTHSTTRTSDTFTAVGLNSKDTVISDTSERVIITVNSSKIQGGVSPGEDVNLEITTQYGATTTHTLNAPEAFTGGEVPL